MSVAVETTRPEVFLGAVREDPQLGEVWLQSMGGDDVVYERASVDLKLVNWRQGG